MLRRNLLAAPLLAAVVAVGVPAASSGAPLQKVVRASGQFTGTLSGDSILVVYSCQASATPLAIATGISRCSITGSGKNSHVALPATAAAVAGTARTKVFPVELCWTAFAVFPDATIKQTGKCIKSALGPGSPGGLGKLPSAGAGFSQS
jgi:hypothetical protein